MSEDSKAYELIVRGRVQGVFFRASTLRKAKQLNTRGWVQNEPDGTVRIWVEGPTGQVEEFISWCHRGPEYASVLEVLLEVHHPQGFADFEIRH